MVILSDQMLSNTKKDMFYALRLAENQIDYQQPLNQQINKLNDLAYTNQTRLTIIDEKGKVLADTDKTAIKENHSDREEFKEAMLHNMDMLPVILLRLEKTWFMWLIFIVNILCVLQFLIMVSLIMRHH